MNILPAFNGLPELFGDRHRTPDGHHEGSSPAPAATLAYSYTQSSSVTVTLSDGARTLSYAASSSQSASLFTQGGSPSQGAPQALPGLPPVVRSAQVGQSAEDSAANILKFIEARLETQLSEGASADELAATLDAGLQGFEQGRDEAISILQGYGFYTPDIEASVATTTELVTAGIDELRASYLGAEADQPAGTQADVSAQTPALEVADSDADNVVSAAAESSPQPANPAPGPRYSVSSYEFIESYQQQLAVQQRGQGHSHRGALSSYRERFAAQESLDLQVTTRDGDQVTIHISAEALNSRNSAFAAFFQRDNGLVSSFGAGLISDSYASLSTAFSLDIVGELDSEEAQALDQLLAQIQELAAQFYAGDLDAAVQSASELNLDPEQLLSMSLNMEQSRYLEVERAYLGDKPGRGHGSHHGHGLRGLGHYAGGLMNALQQSSVFADGRTLLSELFAANFAQLDLLENPQNDTQNPRGDQAFALHEGLLDSLAALRASQTQADA